MHIYGPFFIIQMKQSPLLIKINTPSCSCELIFTRCLLNILILTEMTKRDVPGFAIGGLSGGEEKDDFWRMVTLSTDHLPRGKPRYLMGVGYIHTQAVSILVTFF